MEVQLEVAYYPRLPVAQGFPQSCSGSFDELAYIYMFVCVYVCICVCMGGR